MVVAVWKYCLPEFLLPQSYRQITIKFDVIYYGAMHIHYNNNTNNNKTCNAHISTLLGVQGAVKPKTKQKNKTQHKEKQTQQN